jgi:hypothetical protein
MARTRHWILMAVAMLATIAAGQATAAAAPGASLSPTSLTYAARDTGTTSDPQTITIKNTGTSGLFINSAQTRGTDPLDFTQVDDQCSGLTIAPGGTCTVAIVFKPTEAGTRSGTFILTDNAPNSPQTASLTGTGTTPAGTTPPPLAIDNEFFTCSGGVCDVGAGSNVFINNFFTPPYMAQHGTPPYRFSGTAPAGEKLRPSGLMLGSPTALGTQRFSVTVTDATGATATGTYSLTPQNPPGPTPSGCQTGPKARENLTGPAINGKTPTGTATADMTKFSGCGGFSILTASVFNVALPDGRQLWVTLDFGPVGTITLKGGSGAMKAYNLGDFGVSRDQIRVYDNLPDGPTFNQILIGGAFR